MIGTTGTKCHPCLSVPPPILPRSPHSKNRHRPNRLTIERRRRHHLQQQQRRSSCYPWKIFKSHNNNAVEHCNRPSGVVVHCRPCFMRSCRTYNTKYDTPFDISYHRFNTYSIIPTFINTYNKVRGGGGGGMALVEETKPMVITTTAPYHPPNPHTLVSTMKTGTVCTRPIYSEVMTTTMPRQIALVGTILVTVLVHIVRYMWVSIYPWVGVWVHPSIPSPMVKSIPWDTIRSWGIMAMSLSYNIIGIGIRQ